MPTRLFCLSDLQSMGEPRNILIVEDNQFAAMSLRMALMINGHQVDIAYDGNSAIDAILQKRPHVVLIDIGLPGIDGYEVARRVRATASIRDLPLIAITGYGQSQDRARSLAAGINVHMVKPVDIEELERVIANQTFTPLN